MAEIKPIITIDDIEKLDVRVGTILNVEDVERSTRMVKLTVDFGEFTRNILVGFKTEREDPTEVIGKQAIFIVNLGPKKISGEVSEGMIFDIGYLDGIKPVLAVPEFPVPNGSRLG